PPASCSGSLRRSSTTTRNTPSRARARCGNRGRAVARHAWAALSPARGGGADPRRQPRHVVGQHVVVFGQAEQRRPRTVVAKAIGNGAKDIGAPTQAPNLVGDFCHASSRAMPSQWIRGLNPGISENDPSLRYPPEAGSPRSVVPQPRHDGRRVASDYLGSRGRRYSPRPLDLVVGSRGGIRTPGQAVNSRLLYH